MKKSFFFLLCLYSLLVSCNKDDDDKDSSGGSTPVTDSEIKKWIRDKMDTYYLWNDKMPAENTISKTSTIEDYFENLLYRDNKKVERRQDTYGDRFSHINNLSAATRSNQIAEEDFGGMLTLIGISDTELIGQFLYTSPDSPIGAEGKIKRGTIFNKVDGRQLTNSNYTSLLSKESMTISNDSKYGTPLGPTVITKATYPGTPILYSDVLEVDNHLVGYLVYNEFKRGPDNDDFNNTLFEGDLKTIFKDFKTRNIDKFILDMRYNPGGYLVTAQLLASLIAPKEALGEVLAYHTFNSSIEKNSTLKEELGGDTDYFLTASQTPYNIDMNDICIITSENTASASEFVLNCLKPYMNVIQVGETTVGKNQSALTFKREPKKDWEISPIISYVANSKKEGHYEAGITPDPQNICHDYKMIEEGGKLYISDVNLYNFGDIEHELMLRQALIALGLNIPSPRMPRATSTDVLRIAKSRIITPQKRDKGLIKTIIQN